MRSRAVFLAAIIGTAVMVFAPTRFGFSADSVSGGRGKIEIVCTTTSLSSVVDAVGGERVTTRSVIPYGMCPGHFDLSPGEARSLFGAELVLYHGYEQFINKIDFLNTSRVVKAVTFGNWMIPETQIEAVRNMVAILSNVDPSLGNEFTVRGDSYIETIRSSSDSLKVMLASCRDIPVVTSGMNRDITEWMGFNVVADFPRDEDISIKTMHEIIVRSRERKVRLVIDNMQSSGKIGRTIANDLGVPYIVLTNFPDTTPSALTGYPYIRSLFANCESVLNVLNPNAIPQGGSR